MKNQILDDTLVDDLRWSLDPDEKVIWEGRPNLNLSYWFLTTGACIIFPCAFFYMIGQPQFFIFFFAAVAFIFALNEHFKKKRTRYLITDQRIIFKLPENVEEKNVYALPFEEIRNSRIEFNNTICFTVKKSNHIWPMDELKLEGINDFEVVEKFIQQGIRGKL